MSYCRWSSDNFNCDLYCFEHVDGYFQTYVAGYRHRAWLRIFNFLTDRRMRGSGYTIRYARFKTWRLPQRLTHKRIGLPHDGASFQDATEQEMFDRIKALHQLGYHVPKDLLK